MNAHDFDLTATWFVLASDEGPLHGDPLSIMLWTEHAAELIAALVSPKARASADRCRRLGFATVILGLRKTRPSSSR
jgi:hypothetical protein